MNVGKNPLSYPTMAQRKNQLLGKNQLAKTQAAEGDVHEAVLAEDEVKEEAGEEEQSNHQPSKERSRQRSERKMNQRAKQKQRNRKRTA